MLSSRAVQTRCFLARMDLRWSTQRNWRCRILFQAGNHDESSDVPVGDSSAVLSGSCEGQMGVVTRNPMQSCRSGGVQRRPAVRRFY
ncbi:unnamed protein product [Gadus morhua 'NCC']